VLGQRDVRVLPRDGLPDRGRLADQDGQQADPGSALVAEEEEARLVAQGVLDARRVLGAVEQDDAGQGPEREPVGEGPRGEAEIGDDDVRPAFADGGFDVAELGGEAEREALARRRRRLGRSGAGTRGERAEDAEFAARTGIVRGVDGKPPVASEF